MRYPFFKIFQKTFLFENIDNIELLQNNDQNQPKKHKKHHRKNDEKLATAASTTPNKLQTRELVSDQEEEENNQNQNSEDKKNNQDKKEIKKNLIIVDSNCLVSYEYVNNVVVQKHEEAVQTAENKKLPMNQKSPVHKTTLKFIT